MASAISWPSSDWSRSTPRYRMDVLAVTFVSPHVTFISELMRSLLLVPKRIHSVLPKWMESLLSTNHLLRENSSLPRLSSIRPTSLPETQRAESSAYKISWQENAAFLSLKYSRKYNGPRMYPCGTPQGTTPGSEKSTVDFYNNKHR